MHLKSVSISELRAFRTLYWDLGSGELNGWHVIIGDNGSGKTTFMRAISLALCGMREIQALREDWKTWLRETDATGHVAIAVSDDCRYDRWAGKGKILQNFYPQCGLDFKRNDQGEVAITKVDFPHDPARHIWSGKPGWFSAAYGPFRRFTGGDPEQKRLFYSHPILARHLTIFGENIALTEALEWLGQLRFEELDGNKASGVLLNAIKDFVNQEGFLPHGVRFDKVSSKEVLFRNPEGLSMDVARLSDGYRSILSLTFELIRQMVACYQTPDIFQTSSDGRITISTPGVVLIDEIDVHLHPSWQRRIGHWFTDFFPEVQFIVSTHSPLVCQAAEKGSIFRLPSPGTEQIGSGFVEGIARERLLFGDVLDAYGTELFGEGVDRSDTAKEKMAELARLNQKAAKKKLTGAEVSQRKTLMKTFSGHAPS